MREHRRLKLVEALLTIVDDRERKEGKPERIKSADFQEVKS